MATKSKIKVHVKKPSSPVTLPPKKKKKNIVGGMVADYDVRIAVYSTGRKTKDGKVIETGIINFSDSLEELLTNSLTDRIELRKVDNKLYFKNNTYGKYGDGTSCVSSGKLQYSKAESIDLMKEFIGEFPLDYDQKKDTYYVDLEKRKDLTNTLPGNAHVPHPNVKRKKGTSFNGISEPIAKGVSENPALDVDLKILDVKSPDAKTKLDKLADSVVPTVSVDPSKEKADILQLLDILDNDETNAYARSIVRLIKDKVTAL